MNSDIYISASRRDFEAVSKIKSILHSAGYTYSGDIQSIQAASDFEQTIRAEIISSKAVLCVLSGNSSSSVYTEEDLRLAIKENKTIIPIIIDNTEPVNLGKIGHFLLEIPVIRLNPYDSKSAKVILLHEIEKRCGTKDQKETLNPCANDIKNVQYDVFISCKSEDYPFARKVYQYLREHNYNVFLADTELRKKGNAEYGEIIDEALDSATHMVIVATKPEYIMSAYVKSEWRTFIEEKRSGRKMGNIVTLIEFTISDLPISLRHFQSFNLKSFDCIADFLPLSTTGNLSIKQKLFPLYGIILGETSVKDLETMRFNIDYDSDYITINPDTGYEEHCIEFLADSQTSIITDVEISSGGFPLNWNALGISWEMSYRQWTEYFRSLNFKIKVLEEPHREYWEEKDYWYLSACFKAISPTEDLFFFLTFSYGSKGFDLNSQDTLLTFEISTKKQTLICELDGYDEYEP